MDRRAYGKIKRNLLGVVVEDCAVNGGGDHFVHTEENEGNQPISEEPSGV